MILIAQTWFFWNNNTDKNGKSSHSSIQTIASDKICRPKCKGAIGIRNTEDVNAAFLAKHNWIILLNQTIFGSKMDANYLKIIIHVFFMLRKLSSSNAWKNILDHRYLLRKSLMWIIRNGQSINVWYDDYMKDSPLINNIKPNTGQQYHRKCKRQCFYNVYKTKGY